MKLNLLPVTASRGAKSRSAWIVSSLMIVVGVVGCIYMISSSTARLRDAKAAIVDPRTQATKAQLTAAEADNIIVQAAPFERNSLLAQSMIAHNASYPRLYENVFSYIPPFFRIYSIAAVPAGADNAQVTLSGTLTTYQQYADLMLALMRNPNVISVSRAGFTSNDLMVPALQPNDQIGRPRRPNEAPIPDDPLERLTYFETQGASAPQGYQGVGNFGSGEPSTRFAAPGDSAITVTLLMKAALQVPNPTATLTAGAAAAGAGAGVTGAGGPGSAIPGAGVPGAATTSAPGERPGAKTGDGEE